MVQKAFDECSNVEKYNIYKVHCELQSQVLGGHQNVNHHEKRETHLQLANKIVSPIRLNMLT